MAALSSESERPVRTARYGEASYDEALASVRAAVAQREGLRVAFVGADGTQRREALGALVQQVSLNAHHYEVSNLLGERFVETQGNLREAFDKADEGAALLFFDGADVLFAPSPSGKAPAEQDALTPADYFFQRARAFPGALVLCLSTRYADDVAARGVDLIVEF